VRDPRYHAAMFFTLSKVLWTLVEPGNLLLIVLTTGVVLTITPWRRLGQGLIVLVTAAFLAIAIFPVGHLVIQGLENRFPQPTLPEDITGVVVLGGMIDQFVSRERSQPAVGSAIERLTEFAKLARRYPDAKLVFSGGSGRLDNQDVKEAEQVEPFLASLGLDTSRVFFESDSRNTHENAELSRRAMQPQPGEIWVLVTSAAHMPRSVGAFRKAGWPVIAYPVDYSTVGDDDLEPTFRFTGGLASLGSALHEWLGLTFYYLTGRTSAWYPAPESPQEGG
jgi:uncharacterized SAM-binding protein YcdF (DUF218 family)